MAARKSTAAQVLASGVKDILDGRASADDVMAQMAAVRALEAAAEDQSAVPDMDDPSWPGHASHQLTTDDVLVAPPNAKNVTPKARKATPKERATSGKPVSAVPTLAEVVMDAAQVPAGEKRCRGVARLSIAAHVAPRSAFSVKRSSKDGLGKWCKECQKADRAERHSRKAAGQPVQERTARKAATPKAKTSKAKTPAAGAQRKPKAQPAEPVLVERNGHGTDAVVPEVTAS